MSEIEVIPTGIIPLDLAFGIGGFPRGRISEIYGPEAAGKTTIALKAIAGAQAKGFVAALVDTEYAFDPDQAKLYGVNVDDLLIAQPGCAEDALEAIDKLTASKEVGLIVLDSVAALVPRAEVEGEMGDAHMGLQARLMSQAMRKLTPLCAATKTAIIFINQLRYKIGIVFGNPETTPGGAALKFYASIRLDIRRGDQVKDGTEVIGHQIKCKVVKNKLSIPYKLAEFQLTYGQDITPQSSLLDMGLKSNKIEQRGAFYFLGDRKLGRGRNEALASILSDLEGIRLAVV